MTDRDRWFAATFIGLVALLLVVAGSAWMPHHHTWGQWLGPGWPVMMSFMLLLPLGLAAAIAFMLSQAADEERELEAAAVLDLRLARGEISLEEHAALLAAIQRED